MSQTELTPRVARRLFPGTASDALVSSIRETPQCANLSETSSATVEVRAESGSTARANLTPERWLAQIAVQLGQLTWLINGDRARATILRVTSHLVVLAVLIGAVGMAGAARAATPINRAGRQVASSGDPGRNVSFNVSPASQTVTNTDENLTFVGQGGPIQIDQAIVAPLANPYTTIPNRQRRDVIRYTVQAGDTLFGIAALYGLTPESLLWANYDALQDNPHLLKTGMELNIPPVNGIVYTVVESDTVESIAEKFKATPDAIYQDGYEWNQLKPGQQPVVGAVLIIPGGSREFKSWALTQADNSPSSTGAAVAGVPVAHNSNAGFCPDVPAGLVGTGTFIWPADQHWVSGNNYAPWHPGIDIAAHMGDPIYAADNGVVVYAGWNTWGYGNLVVIDHGNGWQTYYAHNSALYVGCGQNVFKGAVISAAGSTGRSTGPHLHFETRFNGTLPNPFNVLPPP
jgi:murein DD-endopeptidase MepM/ murein hydrolase activator NlpD